MRSNWKILALWVLFISAWTMIVFFAIKSEPQCGQVVFLEDQLGMDCQDVVSYKNGMSTIFLCDDTKLEVPTNRIIKITYKKD